jgi:uncharacterized protein
MTAMWPALLLGLAGNLHCAGMCGGIALALPGRGGQWQRVLPGRLMYQAGRITTYALLGAIAGLFGKSLSLAGWQQGLSVALGLFILLLTFFTAGSESRFLSIPLVSRVMGHLRMRLGHFLKRDSSAALFNLGILNGLLPCGFVYLALAGAVAAGEVGNAMLYMAIFGAATLPTMLTLSLLGSFKPALFRNVSRPVLLGLSFLFAIVLILRGLNLGIPYLSPELGLVGSEALCH